MWPPSYNITTFFWPCHCHKVCSIVTTRLYTWTTASTYPIICLLDSKGDSELAVRPRAYLHRFAILGNTTETATYNQYVGSNKGALSCASTLKPCQHDSYIRSQLGRGYTYITRLENDLQAIYQYITRARERPTATAWTGFGAWILMEVLHG